MAAALQIRRTGELYRLIDQTDRGAWVVAEGAVVRCYDALIWQGRGRGHKRRYDAVLPILFKLEEHRIMDVQNDIVLAQELRRAKERMCWRFHPERCTPKPEVAYAVKSAPQPSTDPQLDLDHWRRELLRLSQKALDYLCRPGTLKETDVSVLKYDLTNVLAYFKALEKKGERGGDKEEGEAAKQDASTAQRLHPFDGEKAQLA